MLDYTHIDEVALSADRDSNPVGSYAAEVNAVREELANGCVVGFMNLYRGSGLTDIGLYLAFHDALVRGLAVGLSPYDTRVGNHNTMVLFPVLSEDADLTL